MKKEVYGKLNIGWNGNILLPLEEAHKVQAILAKYAYGVGEVYRQDNPNIKYVMRYQVPDVTVMEFPEYDARSLNAGQIREWSEAVSHDNGDGKNLMTPDEFTALRRQDNE